MFGLAFSLVNVCLLSKKYISIGQITIVTTGQLLTEIKEVTSRERLKKYFPKQSVVELLELL